MIKVIVGQRGVGKSTLLRRLKQYALEHHLPAPQILDLDEVIVQEENQSINDLFSIRGELEFRSLEGHYFRQICESHEMNSTPSDLLMVAVGGGFNLELIPPSTPILWVQRPGDISGRIFLDRPPLEKDLSPLDEFFARAKIREVAFQKRSWFEYNMPEGLKGPDSIEYKMVFEDLSDVGGILTLLPENFPRQGESKQRWDHFISTRMQWGVGFFEIRDDWLSEEQIQMLLCSVPKQKLFWSRRTRQIPLLFQQTLVKDWGGVDWDWTLADEKALKSRSQPFVISIHGWDGSENPESFFSAPWVDRRAQWEAQGAHIKLAIEIPSFKELVRFHQWAQGSPLSRTFLPRSSDGRWQWYRLWMAPKSKISFWREGRGSALDQPTLYQWLNRQQIKEGFHFAALLGDPVDHSRTPLEQRDFFLKQKKIIIPICVGASEFKEAFLFLNTLGLTEAAVTSPLKALAFQVATDLTSEARRFQAVNTLAKGPDGTWIGTNTDGQGFEALVDNLVATLKKLSLRLDRGVIWGGGGTLEMMRSLLPEASCYGVKTGDPRPGQAAVKDNQPQWIIWASGDFKIPGSPGVPEGWKPRCVVDLNYKENSGGRELALKTGAVYISGEAMFLKQAEAQRDYWSHVKTKS